MDKYSSCASRRQFLIVSTAAGVASGFFAGALSALAATKRDEKITGDMIDAAAALAGITIPPEKREAMLSKLNEQRRAYSAIRQLHLLNDVPPAFQFDPLVPGKTAPPSEPEPVRTPAPFSDSPAIADPEIPKDLEKLAFATVRELGVLIRRGKISAVDLTEMYLARLQRYNPRLKFLITLTEDRARTQAKEADADLGKGRYRGPLHGIPWGAKDLLAVRGYPTTWGAGGFQQQIIDDDATVVRRLDEAGAVLLAKLSLGALAMGDEWFGGRTRNPWNNAEGSSGSSAGSASATAAGCVAFAIGSETLGSISSPSTRCGTTGFRPTFGFVPRTGAMALAWTMDKLGPICRSADDCALAMQAIYGPDGSDLTVRAAPFRWDENLDWKQLRVGYAKSAFENASTEEKPPEGASAEELKQWESRRPDGEVVSTR